MLQCGKCVHEVVAQSKIDAYLSIRMSDLVAEIDKLHVLRGAEFSRQVNSIASRPEFHLVEGEECIYAVGDYKSDDYANQIVTARKAVEHGYIVYILPNPNGLRTADYILEFKRIRVLYELKTIRGKGSAGTRLLESIGQSNRVILSSILGTNRPGEFIF